MCIHLIYGFWITVFCFLSFHFYIDSSRWPSNIGICGRFRTETIFCRKQKPNIRYKFLFIHLKLLWKSTSHKDRLFFVYKLNFNLPSVKGPLFFVSLYKRSFFNFSAEMYDYYFSLQGLIWKFSGKHVQLALMISNFWNLVMWLWEKDNQSENRT